MSHNTLARPSDFAPECPECETDIFVDATRSHADDYACRYCGTRWSDE